MQLLDKLLSHTDIQAYLSQHAPEDWHTVIAKTLLYGIHSLHALHTAELQTNPIQILDISNVNDLSGHQSTDASLAQATKLQVSEKVQNAPRYAGKENMRPASGRLSREIPRVLQPVELPLTK